MNYIGLEVKKKNNKSVKGIVIDENNNSVNVKIKNTNDIKKFKKNEIEQVNKLVSKKNIANIKNDGWILPMHKDFQEWIKKKYVKYISHNSNKKAKNNKTGFEPFGYQKLLRDFMSHESPYRGILLYHGLGSGKTCTAITIAESMKTARKIIVMLPASLQDNFINDGLLFCGDPKYKSAPELIKHHYIFVSTNASNTYQQLQSIGSLDNSVIIIDEVHNLISRMSTSIDGKSKQGKNIYQMLMDAKNTKIIAMTGTPMINDAVEAGILLNILRGYMYVHIFQIKDLSPTNSSKSIENKIYSIPMIEYNSVNIPYKTVEIISPKLTANDILEETAKLNIKLIFEKTLKFTAFPSEKEQFNEYFLDTTNPVVDKLKNFDLFRRRSLGLVSYYQPPQKDFPTLKIHPFERIEMSNYQFIDYTTIRDIERDKEILSARLLKIKKKHEQPTSLMRIYSREISNFAFPEEIPRPFPSGTKKLLTKSKVKSSNNKNNKNNEINILEKSENIEHETEEGESSDKKYQEEINETLKKLYDERNVYLTLDKLKIYSPKMLKILENIKKEPKKLNFVYSQFRTLEGIGIFSLILETNGFEKFNYKTPNVKKPCYALYSGTEDAIERRKTLDIFNSPENKYGDKISILLASSAGAEGLNLKNIRQIHIMEPYWNEIRIQQVIGRGVRRGSHIALPVDERTVDVYRYMTVFTKEQIKQSKEKITTDEYIYKVARKKEGITNDILKLLKEVAIDCAINKLDPNIECFSFKSTGLASHPDIVKNRAFSTEGSTRKITRKVFLGRIDKNNKVYSYEKEKKKYYLMNDKGRTNPFNESQIKWKNNKMVVISPDTGNIYDVNSVKKKSPIVIHKYKNSQLIN